MLCIGVSLVANASEPDTEKLTKSQRKAIEKRNREIKDSLDHEIAVKAMNEGYYVLMADRMMIRGRPYLNPESNTNFVLIQGDEAVIQLAINNGRLGLNGMGGITVEGKISGMRGGVPDKKGKVTYDFNVSGPVVSAQVHITLYKEDNQAVAIVSPNFWSGNLTVYGRIVPYYREDYDKVFKGATFP